MDYMTKEEDVPTPRAYFTDDCTFTAFWEIIGAMKGFITPGAELSALLRIGASVSNVERVDSSCLRNGITISVIGILN
jgi:hypothetical protein